MTLIDRPTPTTARETLSNQNHTPQATERNKTFREAEMGLLRSLSKRFWFPRFSVARILARVWFLRARVLFLLGKAPHPHLNFFLTREL